MPLTCVALLAWPFQTVTVHVNMLTNQQWILGHSRLRSAVLEAADIVPHSGKFSLVQIFVKILFPPQKKFLQF